MPEESAKEPEKTEPVKPEPVKTEPASALATALGGDDVPEKFRGKTVKDVLQSADSAIERATRAEALSAQWQAWYQANAPLIEKVQKGVEPAEEAEPPFSPEQITAMQQLMGGYLHPIFEGIGALSKELVKSTYEDFPDYEERATQVFNSLPPNFKADPRFGWLFAYRWSKTEDGMKKEPFKFPNPPQPSPSLTGPSPSPKEKPLTDEQKKWMKLSGMTEAEYKQWGGPPPAEEEEK